MLQIREPSPIVHSSLPVAFPCLTVDFPLAFRCQKLVSLIACLDGQPPKMGEYENSQFEYLSASHRSPTQLLLFNASIFCPLLFYLSMVGKFSVTHGTPHSSPCLKFRHFHSHTSSDIFFLQISSISVVILSTEIPPLRNHFCCLEFSSKIPRARDCFTPSVVPK